MAVLPPTKRRELGDFLRAHRARLSPASLGLPRRRRGAARPACGARRWRSLRHERHLVHLARAGPRHRRPPRPPCRRWRARCSSRRPSAPISSSWPAGATPTCRPSRRRRHGRAAGAGATRIAAIDGPAYLLDSLWNARAWNTAGGGAVRRLARRRQRSQPAALRLPEPGRAHGHPRLAGAGAPRAGRVPRRFQPPSRGRRAAGAGRRSAPAAARSSPSAGPSMPWSIAPAASAPSTIRARAA